MAERTIQLLTGKQKRYLRSLAHHLKPVLQVGKNGIGGTFLEQMEAALEAHELVKVSVMESSPLLRDEVAEVLVEETGAQCIQTIGKLVVLYRPAKEQPKIVLPKA